MVREVRRCRVPLIVRIPVGKLRSQPFQHGRINVNPLCYGLGIADAQKHVVKELLLQRIHRHVPE